MSWLDALKRRTLRHKMPEQATSTEALDRELSPAEYDFLYWMLSHGNERAQVFISQLDRARVVGRCTCGCASVDLAIDGVTHYPGAGLEVLCEYRWEAVNGQFGVFAFACGDLLAGIDLYAAWGEYPASYLPLTSALESFDEPAA